MVRPHRVQIHTPSGSAPSSPQRDPPGSTLSRIRRPDRGRTRSGVGPGAPSSSSVNCRPMKSRFSMPDAVLTRQHPTRGERRGDDLRAGGVHPVHDPRLLAVEQQQRVQVAVPGVEDVVDRQRMAGGDLPDLGQDPDQLRPGDDGVVEVVVGQDPGDGTEGRLAAPPQRVALDVVGRHPDGPGAQRRGHGGDGFHVGRHPVRRSVELDQQHRGGVPGIARTAEVLDHRRQATVHHLDRGRHDPGRDDVGDAGGGGIEVVEVTSMVRTVDGSGVSRTATAVAMPSVPSPPTNAPRRS